MSRILLITTGGTIAAGADSGAGWALGADLMSGMAGGAQEVDVLDLFSRPSSQIGPRQMLEISHAVAARTGTGEYAGCIVTHGTDTMEETAVWLDIFHETDMTLVLTGAMRSSREPAPDGSANLAASLATCGSSAARGRGVLVVMNEQIHAARLVAKTHSKDAAAFTSPDMGPVGAAYGGRVRFVAPVPAERLVLRRPESVVVSAALVRAVAGDDGRLVDAAVATGFAGVVIEGLGVGNLPQEMAKAVRRACDHGVTVALTTRCGAGPVTRSGLLSEVDVLLAGPGLNGPKARIALLAGLAAGASSETLAALLA